MKKLIPILLIMMMIAGVSAAWAQEAGSANAANGNDLDIKKEIYIYTSAFRRDPFLSLIEKRLMEMEKKKKEKGKMLSPIESYDISQMDLIAIIWNKEMRLAVIGLPDNKFYNVVEGMSIGLKGGEIREIGSRRLVVRELLPNYKGELQQFDTVLRLRNEEGK